MRNLTNDEVFLDLIDEMSPGVIKIQSPFLYVLMPMRISLKLICEFGRSSYLAARPPAGHPAWREKPKLTWRNWQTRTAQDRMGQPVEVRVLS